MQILADIYAHVPTRADQIAVTTAQGSRTYLQVVSAVTRIAARLRATKSTAPIAICCDDAALQIAAIIAALIAARPFLSLDKSVTPAEWAAISPQHKISDILSDRAAMMPCCPVSANDFAPISPWQIPAFPTFQDDALCGFLMTSGSSAQPKLVEIPYLQLLNKSGPQGCIVSVLPDDILAMPSPLGSTNGLSSLFKALRAGAEILILRPAEQGVRDLRQAMTAHRATLLFCTPTLLRSLMLNDPSGNAHLRMVRVSGETLDYADIAKFREWTQTGRIINHYGITEALAIAQADVTDLSGAQNDSVPVGTINPSVDMRLVDTAGQAVEPGDTGRILIASRYLALGYRDDPALTAATFRTVPDGRTFLTGDMGRINENGMLEILGRQGRAANIGGALLHLDLIEDRLRSVDGVAEVAVLTKPAAIGANLNIVGFIAPKAGHDPQDIRRKVLSLRPLAQIPRLLHFLDVLPKTATGKIDRQSLKSRL
jgi:acyl-coenzyme A synthetase/AMP-(fatty) acid ligase